KMLKNLVVFITGGASGLGKATADYLLSNGARVVVFDINAPGDNNLSPKNDNPIGEVFSPHVTNSNCLFFKGNVLSTNDVETAINKAKERWGGLNVALNCAGVSISCRLYNPNNDHPLDLHEIQKVLNTNVVGNFNVIRLAAQAMAENKNEHGENGVIINTSSIAAYHGSGTQTVYSAASGAIVSMTLPIARDLASCGVRVATIAPGFFKTPLTHSNNITDEVKQFITTPNAFPNRFGDPCEFAHLVTTVIENKMINGETIRLDAGSRYEI
uniref:Uncharacterized protein n=1 Tax=Ciona intestinalis TaxID=7719 RepID=F6ZME6_CIOIN